MNDVGKEIDDMLSSFASGPQEPAASQEPQEPQTPQEPQEPQTPQEPTEPKEPVEPKEPTEPKEPAEPQKPQEPVEPQEPQEPAEPQEPEEPETPEQKLERLEAQNKKLMEFIGRSPTETPKPEIKPDEKPDVPEPKPEAPQEIKVEDVDFLKGMSQEEVEKLIESPEALNKLLNQVRRASIESAIPLAQERTMLNVPQVTAAYVKRYNTMKALVDDFYKENEDLKVVQRAVGQVANEVHSEHPDWTIQQVFKEAATKTREALGMPAPTTKPRAQVTIKGQGDPAFAQPRSSRRGGPQKKLTGMAKEIDDLLAD